MFCSACGKEIPDNVSFCGHCGARLDNPALPVNTGNTDTDKLFALLAHLGGIFFGFIPALVIYLVKKDSPGWVLDNAREALNWQLTVLIGCAVAFVLTFILIGILLFWLIFIANLVLIIVATIKASNGEVYRYPFALRLLK